MDGNLDSVQPRKGNIHSNFARTIVNELIVAYYEREMDKPSTICRLKEDKRYNVNPIIKTFFMESVDK